VKALRKLTRLASLDEVSRFAMDIIEAWNILSRDKLLNRQTIVATVASGNNVITHSLGYEPSGYIIVSKSAALSDYLVSKSPTQITINASASATITLEVF